MAAPVDLPPLDPLDHDPPAKVARYERALATFVERLEADRYVLAAVLVGSIDRETIWCRDALRLWVIEADDVTRRRASDGESHRIYRTLAEDDLPIHIELIPRARFKRMVEGASRTSFSCNFFAIRRLVWSRDEAISAWFDDADSVARKDQRNELLTTATWLIHARRDALRELEVKHDLDMAAGEAIGLAWCLAALEVVKSGEIVEGNILYWARDRRPDLFEVVYRAVLDRAGRTEPVAAAIERAGAELAEHGLEWLSPMTDHMKRRGGLVPLSELSDHFAHSQLYPGHLESACEWLVELGLADKHAVPYQLTKRSRSPVEEPAYELRA